VFGGASGEYQETIRGVGVSRSIGQRHRAHAHARTRSRQSGEAG
jgi:hypothetical protein